MRPTCRANVEITGVGKRARAWQYALVLAAQCGRPPMMRLIAASSTACRQLPSAESTCAGNIDKVSVGGNRRSRCVGSSAWTPSRSCALVNTLKNASASVSAARR